MADTAPVPTPSQEATAIRSQLDSLMILLDWGNFDSKYPSIAAALENSAKVRFGEFRKFIEELQGIDFDLVDPYVRNTTLRNAVNSFHGGIQNLYVQSQASPKNTQWVDEQWNKGAKQVVDAKAVILPWLPYLRSKQIESLPKLVAELSEQVKLAAAQIATNEKAAAGLTVAIYKGVFLENSQSKRCEAWCWLGAASVPTLIILGLAGWVLYEGPKKMENNEALQWIGARVILFSLLTYALAVCIRGFRSSMHLAVIDRHRALALQTFEKFIEAAKSDEATKQQVLLKTTECIFAMPATGYVDQKDDGGPQVVEIIKALGPGGKPGG